MRLAREQRSTTVALVGRLRARFAARRGCLTHRLRDELRLGFGGSVTTPKLCVSSDLPHLRFVAEASRSGQLDVTVPVYDSAGNVTDSSSGSVSPSDHLVWVPSRLVGLKSDRFSAGQTGVVTVTFRSQGTWVVDDVLVDPYRR